MNYAKSYTLLFFFYATGVLHYDGVLGPGLTTYTTYPCRLKSLPQSPNFFDILVIHMSITELKQKSQKYMFENLQRYLFLVI